MLTNPEDFELESFSFSLFKDLAGFLNPVGPPAQPEAEMYCPGLCNPICSPACTRSCCYNAPRSEPHWENLPASRQNYGMQMAGRRSNIPDPTKEPMVSCIPVIVLSYEVGTTFSTGNFIIIIMI